MPNRTKDERFAEFVKRLAAAPPASSAREAFLLLQETLIEVENELTNIPYAPDHWQSDGRMYPPQEDAARDVPERDDLVRYRSKAHNTYICTNGAIEIRDEVGAVIFTKAGKDGRGVDLPSDAGLSGDE